MKLKLKLILASMFFCSLIFAQGNVPTIQFRTDRVHSVKKKQVKKIITPQKIAPTKKRVDQKIIQIAPPSNRYQKNKNIPIGQSYITPTINVKKTQQPTTKQIVLPSNRYRKNNNTPIGQSYQSPMKEKYQLDFIITQLTTDAKGKYLLLNHKQKKNYSSPGQIEKLNNQESISNAINTVDGFKIYINPSISDYDLSALYHKLF